MKAREAASTEVSSSLMEEILGNRSSFPLHSSTPAKRSENEVIDFIYPVPGEDLDGGKEKKKAAKRWTYIMQKTLNPKCRHFRRV